MSDGLPGFWRFVWLFWMQPIALHRLLLIVGVDPRESGWKLLRRSRSSQENWWLLRSAQAVLVLTPGAAVAVASVLAALGRHVSWLGAAFGVALGVTIGVAVSVTLGAITVVALGAFGGVIRFTLAGGVAAGAAFGVIASVAIGVGFGRAVEVADGSGERGGSGVIAIATFLAALIRIPVFILETTLQTAARYWNSITGRRTLHWSPVLYHELSYLPHPFLASHILAEADADPALTRRVLDACSIAPGQRRTGRKVEAKLRARELKRLAEAKDFQAIQELRGLWLPGLQGADAILLAFSEAARYLAAGETAFNPHHRLRHLKAFDEHATAIENQLRSQRTVFTQPFEEPLWALREAARKLRSQAEKDAEGLILNPFRAGDPLSDAEGPELFRGREAAVREIENVLADATRSASLQLLAPRRAGKTSLLKMLPRLLPDTICVFFDLQRHPAESVAAFWSNLAEQARIQAKLDRRAELPAPPDGPPMEAAALWLDKLDQLPGGRRILIAIESSSGSRTSFRAAGGSFSS